MVLCMVSSLFVSVSAEETVTYTDRMHQGFETEAELENVLMWDVSGEFAEKGLFGSNGAAKVSTTSANAALGYNMYLEIGQLYNFSAYIKPLDFELTTATLVLMTPSTEGTTGWEQFSMQVEEANGEGYYRVHVDNYRIS